MLGGTGTKILPEIYPPSRHRSQNAPSNANRGRAVNGMGNSDGLNILHRILALLFSFASICDRAAQQPRPLDGLVVWALRQAAYLAFGLVVRQAREADMPRAVLAGLDCDDPFARTDIPFDAAQLALVFRHLAACLQFILEWGEAAGHWHEFWPAPRLFRSRAFWPVTRHAPAGPRSLRVKPPPWHLAA